MADPLAYFLTWTCYGTRLHGDEQGSVDRAHNIRNTPFLAPDSVRESACRNAMTGPQYVLSSDGRAIVNDVIRKHCAIRKWGLIALNVRTTHVHVIVNCHCLASPETAMEQFKAWGTRRLRESSLAGTTQTIWTEHGSTRWIDSESSLAKAIDYVRNQQ